MKLAITRPQPDADRTVTALKHRAVSAFAAPLLSIEIRSASLPTLPEEGVYVFTSANGVRAAKSHGGRGAGYAIGDATATEMSAAGFEVQGVAGGEVESLIAMLDAKLGDRPALHVRGVHSVGDLAERLQARGHDVTAVALYEATAASVLPRELVAAWDGENNGVALFSPRTARILSALLQKEGRLSQASRHHAYCLSPAVADALGDAAFASVHIATQPTLPAFVDMFPSRGT